MRLLQRSPCFSKDKALTWPPKVMKLGLVASGELQEVVPCAQMCCFFSCSSDP